MNNGGIAFTNDSVDKLRLFVLQSKEAVELSPLQSASMYANFISPFLTAKQPNMKNFDFLAAAFLAITLTPACDKKDNLTSTELSDCSKRNAAYEQEYSGWSAPVNLGPVINTSANEQHAFISKDGLSLFLSSNRTGTTGGLDIWVSERESVDAPWGAPVNLGLNINTSADDFAPSLSPDEHWMYFHSARTSPSSSGQIDLYVAHRHNRRDNLNWEPAVNMGPVINSSCDDAGPTYYEDEHGQTILYFTSSRPLSGSGGCIDYNIFSSIRQPKGEFSSPIYVPELSSPYRDTRTAIRRRDGLEIYVSSERPGGPGPRNIWVSTRASSSDPWSTPVIVPTINSTVGDGSPTLSFDAKTLIFTSPRPGGFGANDLYMSTRERLH